MLESFSWDQILQMKYAKLSSVTFQVNYINDRKNKIKHNIPHGNSGPQTSPHLNAELSKAQNGYQTAFEPQHEIYNNVVCVTSKASDQPALTRSLIRAFASPLSIL